MTIDEFGKSMTLAVENNECFACGASTKKSEYNNHICQSTGQYAWGCAKCKARFHLGESYPTRNVEVCPSCGVHDIMEAHRN